MFLDEFIDKQIRLLELERNEEINRSKILTESSPKILEEKNLCIRKLSIINIFTGLYGRTIIEFESKVNKESSKRVFSQGDIIGICVDSSKSVTNNTLATGLFYKSDQNSIQVALDNNLDNTEFLKDLDSDIFRLVKISSEITYSRLKSGLKYLEKRSKPLCGDYLIDLLLGDSSLAIANQKKELKLFNENLNQSQKDAVEFALSRPDIAVIHGPPGTGKTTVAVEIINQILENKNDKKISKILVCTPSNIALDNLAEKLLKSQNDKKCNKSKTKINKLNLLRLGHSARVMPHLSDISLDYKLSCCDQAELISQVRSQIDSTLKHSFKRNDKLKQGRRGELSDLRKELREREMKAVREVLNGSHVIMSTLTGLRSNKSLPLNEIEFDVVLIDEASQAIEVACWLAIPRGRKLIIAGDHKQLPPTVLSEEAAKEGLSLSLMERLLDLYPGDEITRMLSFQYRMNESIMRWSSDTFYKSELIADISVAQHTLEDKFKDNDSYCGSLGALTFIDTAGCDLYELECSQEDSKANLGEAQLAAVYIQQIVTRFNLQPHHIGVITPYNRQVQLIKEEMKKRMESDDNKFSFSQIEVSTVDGFQGREKEVIVTTLVRSNQTGTIGFLAEHRRLNVALTRAKRHLCVIGDSRTIEQSGDKVLLSLVEYWNQTAEIHTAHEYIYEHNISAGDCVKSKPSITNQDQLKHSKKKTEDNNLELEKKVCDQLIKFKMSSKKSRLEFPSHLNSRIRAVLHELAESLQLYHESVGEGKQRKLIIYRTDPNKKLKIEKETKNEEIIENSKSDIESNDVVIIENENHLLDSFDHKECINEVSLKISEKSNQSPPLENNLLILIDSKLSDLAISIEKQSSKLKTEKSSISQIKKKPKRPKSSKQSTNDIPEDLDEMFEHFQSMDKICQNPEKCKTLVSILGFSCQFCKKRFCSTHAQPEVHLCPLANRSAWRSLESKTKPLSQSKEIKHKQLSRAMNNKIHEISANRLPKKKPE